MPNTFRHATSHGATKPWDRAIHGGAVSHATVASSLPAADVAGDVARNVTPPCAWRGLTFIAPPAVVRPGRSIMQGPWLRRSSALRCAPRLID